MALPKEHRELWERGRHHWPEIIEKGLDWYRTAEKASRCDGTVVALGELVGDNGEIIMVWHLIRHPAGSTFELFKAGRPVRWPTQDVAMQAVDAHWPLIPVKYSTPSPNSDRDKTSALDEPGDG